MKRIVFPIAMTLLLTLSLTAALFACCYTWSWLFNGLPIPEILLSIIRGAAGLAAGLLVAAILGISIAVKWISMNDWFNKALKITDQTERNAPAKSGGGQQRSVSSPDRSSGQPLITSGQANETAAQCRQRRRGGRSKYPDRFQHPAG